MDTKALRQKILDLAIRGKLVPQNPNDEPASILLEKIREQKQQMFKEGKLKKKDIKNDSIIFKGEDNLHYEKFADGSVKCIEDEIPFELPEGWSWSRLASLTAIITKGASPKWQGVDYTSSGTMFITSENVGVETLLLESPKFLPEKINEIQPRSILETHDILTNIVGASIGRTCEYTLVDSANTNQAVAIIRLIAVDMVSYVVKCLNSDYCVNLMFANQVNVARANLSLTSLANFLIPIPPLKEMYRIIAHLDCGLRHISGIQSSEDELRQLILFTKTKILDLAIRGKLVPQDPNDEPASVLLERIRAEKEELIKQGKIKRDKKESVIFKGEDNSYYEKIGNKLNCIDEQLPFKLPDGWSYERLGNICSIARGGSPRPIDNYLTDAEDGLNWIKIGDTEQGGKYIYSTKEKIRPEGVSKTRYVHCGDFLLTNSMSFGRPYILKTDGCIHDGWLVIGDVEAVFIQDYLYYMLSSSIMYDLLSRLAAGSTVKNLKSDSVKSLIVPIPPRKEQDKISKHIENVFSIISLIEESLN